MALDQTPATSKELRYRILRNIGNAFVKLGQFQDAIDNYDLIMGGGIVSFSTPLLFSPYKQLSHLSLFLSLQSIHTCQHL